MAEEHAPVTPESKEQSRPVQARPAGLEDVRDVGAVVALALHDEAFRPDHLFRGHEPDGHAEHGVVDRVLEPQLVDGRDPISRAEDDVHQVLAAAGLAEPVRERDLGGAPGVRERREGRIEVARSHEDVEVLRVPCDPRVSLERVRAPDEIRHAGVVQRLERTAVEREGGGIEMLGAGAVHEVIAFRPPPPLPSAAR